MLATETAERALAKSDDPPPLDSDPVKARKQSDRVAVAVSKEVADMLNNTPSVARENYIHPEVFRAWMTRMGGGDL